MPLFLSDEEFQGISHDAALIVEKADIFIRELYNRLETVKADADVALITAEQTCSLTEQKYLSLSAEFSSLQSQHSELNVALSKRESEFAQLQSEKQQLLLQYIEKGGETERLTLEGSELHKSKRLLMEMLERKDLEISEKNATIKSYCDKIFNLTEIGASKEALQADRESELVKLRATSARLLQEKELFERHNSWLNEELTAKVDSFIQLRKEYGQLEMDMSSKLADAEIKFKECSNSLKLQKDRARELEMRLSTVEEELLSTKDASAAVEQRFSAEISTVSKLVDLYKESSEEWSKKAGELEGVIKALETHLNQVENEYKEKLEKEESARKQVENEAADFKMKFQVSEVELEKLRKENELNHLPLRTFTTNSWMNSADPEEMFVNEQAIIPRISAEVSETALAASILRDGWSLAKMYAKYQEAHDAMRHEQLGRKKAQAILERVLYEIEEKAGNIMDERDEHEKLVEAYSLLEQKLKHSLSEHSAMESDIQELKANLKRQEREYNVAQKEIVDLQNQIVVLLKECRDVQLRCGFVSRDDELVVVPLHLNTESDVENIISTKLLTFKDINGLVENNSQLRSLVRDLSNQIKEKETELKVKYEMELQKLTDETASKVNAVLLRAEEQGHMIESLHTSVAMYKKLYEELKVHSSYNIPNETAPEAHGSKEVLLLKNDTSNKVQEQAIARVQEQAIERVKILEEDLSKSRSDMISLRTECGKLALEAKFAQEKLARFMKEYEHQREEHNGVLARNVEFSQLIINYQKKLRESSDSLDASSELARKLTMEVSILKHEKEILQNSEKRAFDEVCILSERAHRLQASLDTIQSAGDAREETRGVERRMQDEHIRKIEREWAEAKSELQEERNNIRSLGHERESTLKDAFRQVEESNKELANALQSVAAAESRAAVAEARCSHLEKIMASSRMKDSDVAEGDPLPSNEKILGKFQEEIEKLRNEVQDNQDHMLQYKGIAHVNEAALKQLESAYENFRTQAYDERKSLEAEIHSLKERANELETECKLKTNEASTASSGKEEALLGALFEISSLKEVCSAKTSQIVLLESQISIFKEDLEKEHQRWRSAQANYERQVILQSETIQELRQTSEALAASQEEVSDNRKLSDVLKIENDELRLKWETEKFAIEVYKTEADKRYNEVNELNKVLLTRLEALHIKSAEKERENAFGSSSLACVDDDGLQNVVNYLRRTKEIAETEISLLKQEKLRLQSQLDSALKSAQAAESSLQSERTNSRVSLTSEEEFKSLQLQVRELTLLRESNMQLREENRHNFEECQNLREAFQNVRNETENLQKLLRDRETDVESCRREIEYQKMEKINFEKRVNELVEKYRDVDVDDYNQMKSSFQLLQLNLKEKEAHIEELKKLVSEKEDAVSQLEQDLALSKTELNERDTKIAENLQSETVLRSEIEKVRRLNVQARRKSDNLLKEKEDLSKELQALTKQLDDAKQAKRNLADSAGEQALAEKEKEKDTRIQILERTLERHREDLKKEKEDHNKVKEKSQKIRKTIVESREIVIQQKAKLLDELSKHKQALKILQDEVEKLKSSRVGQSESASIVKSIAFPVLDDLSSAYFHAVENFELIAQPACNELESSTVADVQSQGNTSIVGALIGQPAASLTQTLATPASNVAPRTVEEKERKPVIAKAIMKAGRKLVRPSITKPKEPQGDMDVSEVDEPNIMLSSNNSETQGKLPLPISTIARKRPSASFSSDMQEEMFSTEETNSDMAAPLLKRPKSSGAVEERSSDASKLVEAVLTEDSPDDVMNLTKEELAEPEREELENLGDQVDEPTVDDQIQDELRDDAGEVSVEKLSKPSEVAQCHEQFRDQIELEIQQLVRDSFSEREDGELIAEVADNSVDDYISNEMGYPGVGDILGEKSVEPENSPGIESFVPATLEVGEIDPSQTLEEEKNDGGDVPENVVESSNKLNDGVDPVVEPDQFSGPVNTTSEEASASTFVDVGASEQGGAPTLTPDTEGKPISPVNSSTTTINLQERARQRAYLRQAGLITPLPNRGRGRTVHNRGVRGGRTGRGGQSPG